MKKLMIAAAAAAMVAGVYAVDGQTASSTCAEYNEDNPTGCPVETLVYQWQFKGKTGTGVLVDTTKTTTTSSLCAEPDTVTSGVAEAVRVPGSLAIVAYSYLCDVECSNLASKFLAPYKTEYWATAPFKSSVYRNNNTQNNFVTSVNPYHVIGKTATQCEMAGTAQFTFGNSDPAQVYNLTFAGFGSYDKKAYRMTSVSGNFAGTQVPPRYLKTIDNERCPEAYYWDCCNLSIVVVRQAPSVAYGTWSVKYNATATKKFNEKPNVYWVK